MLTKRRVLNLVGLVVMAVTIFSFCGNNAFHQAMASGILTMKECLKCHNGVMARAISICVGNNCLYTKNHSIMRPYPPPGKEHNYASVSEIEHAGCILENGKITCLSCHDLTKPPPHTIRPGDQLCYICHIDKKPFRLR
jgi:hypothetical protein